MAAFDHKWYVEYCLNRLSVEIGARPAGSQANRAAADFIAAEMKEAGYEVFSQEYLCPVWQASSSELTVAGRKVRAVVNTHSPSCEVEGELILVSSTEDVQTLDLSGKIAVVHSEITRGGFMPKNFDRRYYVDENKDRFIDSLEKRRPSAVITVSHHDIPLPVIEDSEFTIPSVTAHRNEGSFLIENAHAKANLKIVTESRPGIGSNLIGRRGNNGKKVLVCAHYDTKPGTPGAMDNAAGISALLSLARRLREAETKLATELVAYGGEDSWFPGDALYIQEYPPVSLVAAVNIDGIGMKDANTRIAFFECPANLVARIMNVAKDFGEYVQEPFYESDHGFFWPLGIPTMAFTSRCVDLLGKVTHTENDTVDLLDIRKIERTAGLVHEIVLMLDQRDLGGSRAEVVGGPTTA